MRAKRPRGYAQQDALTAERISAHALVCRVSIRIWRLVGQIPFWPPCLGSPSVSYDSCPTLECFWTLFFISHRAEASCVCVCVGVCVGGLPTALVCQMEQNGCCFTTVAVSSIYIFFCIGAPLALTQSRKPQPHFVTCTNL